MRLLLLLCGLFLFVTVQAGPGTPPKEETAPRRTLHLEVDNIRKAKGKIWVGIYRSEADFLDREKARLIYVEVNAAGRATVEIPDLIIGKEYALGIFHDENDNGEFDTNWLGLPAEPWAFSGEPKTRLRLPRFHEVSFRLNSGSERSQIVRLRKW